MNLKTVEEQNLPKFNDVRSVNPTPAPKLEAPDFQPADLLWLPKAHNAPILLKTATNALIELAEDKSDFNRFADTFSSYSEGAYEVRALFRLCDAALAFLKADFVCKEASEVQFLREQVAQYEAAAPKSEVERVVDVYWQTMERLSAAGAGFDALLNYHNEKDGEVEDDSR